MLHSPKDKQERELLKMYRELQKLWKERYTKGAWVEVERPFQQGWIRYYVLRQDASNRTDAREMRQALDMINSRRICRREDFTRKDYKTGLYGPIPQPLGWLTPERWGKLNEKVQSFFECRKGYEYDRARRHQYEYERYVFKRPFYAEFRIVPNIVHFRWVPNIQVEGRIAELSNKIEKNNWWPRINHIQGKSSHYRDRPRYKNKYGDSFFEEDFDTLDTGGSDGIE